MTQTMFPFFPPLPLPVGVEWHLWNAGAGLNIKMSSFQYRNFHYKDKTVIRLSYLYNGNPHTWKDSLYIEMGPCLSIQSCITTLTQYASPCPGNFLKHLKLNWYKSWAIKTVNYNLVLKKTADYHLKSIGLIFFCVTYACSCGPFQTQSLQTCDAISEHQTVLGGQQTCLRWLSDVTVLVLLYPAWWCSVTWHCNVISRQIIYGKLSLYNDTYPLENSPWIYLDIWIW